MGLKDIKMVSGVTHVFPSPAGTGTARGQEMLRSPARQQRGPQGRRVLTDFRVRRSKPERRGLGPPVGGGGQRTGSSSPCPALCQAPFPRQSWTPQQ